MTHCMARATTPRSTTQRVLIPEVHGAVDLSLDLDAEYLGIIALKAVDANVEGNDAADVDHDDGR